MQGAEQINNYGKSLSEITGSLKLAIPDSILIYTIQPFIQAFLHEAPNIQLMINSIPSEEVSQAVTIIHKNLGTYRALLVAAPFANSSLLDFITPHQRKPFSLICNEPNGYYQLEMDRYLAKKDIILFMSITKING